MNGLRIVARPREALSIPPSMRLHLVFLAVITLAASGSRAAFLEYPPLGNIDLSEGTLELWLTPLASMEPTTEAANWKKLFDFCEIQIPGSFSCAISWTQNKDRARFRVRCEEAGGGMIPISMDKAPPVSWAKDQPFRIAFVWKDRWMGIYADGKLLGEKDQNVPMQGPIGELILRFGSPKMPVKPWLLRALRISSVARAAEDMPENPPQADAATLLLDVPADGRGDGKITQPRVVALIAGQPVGGVIGRSEPSARSPDGLIID